MSSPYIFFLSNFSLQFFFLKKKRKLKNHILKKQFLYYNIF